MKIYEISEYNNEIKKFSKSLNLSFLRNKTVLIAGASGLIMSYLIDTILFNKNQKTRIIALTSSGKAIGRFKNDKRLSFVKGDVKNFECLNKIRIKLDIIINGASIVDPKGYMERPIDTMLINILGTKNLLDIAVKHNATFFLASSCKVYGDINELKMNELCCGKLDTLDIRNCYSESKRACETMCVAYGVEKNIKTYIGRFSRVFGPTQSQSDTKALSQLINNGILKENIVLKSKGNQLFSYTYVQDAVSGMLKILEKGKSMNAYNICNNESLKLRDIASIVAKLSGTKVVFKLKNDGFSKETIAIQDSTKLCRLGWSPNVSIESGIAATISILKKLYY